jgi:DNA-binding transcriptional regulator YdaS (Cro superfamily)
MNSIQKAVQAAGGAKALAKKLEISRQAVEKWIEHERIPAERVLELEEFTGISRHDLRPDLYPRDSAA